jgi:hypothetical protein
MAFQPRRKGRRVLLEDRRHPTGGGLTPAMTANNFLLAFYFGALYNHGNQ